MRGTGEGKENSKGDKGNKDKVKGKKGSQDKKGNGKAKGKGAKTPHSTDFEDCCNTCWKWEITSRKTAGREQRVSRGTR